MANLDYTQEDQAGALSAEGLASVVIQALGSTDISGVKLLGEKSDTTLENIKSDDSGRLMVSH